MANTINPLNNYTAGLIPQATLNGTIGTIVYASNYNDLDNKPSINSVELRGNKTANELGLATPEDITVTSVNNQIGDVSITGANIAYDNSYSVTDKINDLESQIVDSGVDSVNGMTGNVTLTASDINYSVGASIKNKIDEVEQEIPIVSYPVTSVNTKTGAVVLGGNDIEYSSGVSVNSKIDAVEQSIPVVDYPVTSVNEQTGAVSLTGEDIPVDSTAGAPSTATAIGDLSTLTTSVTSSLVGAVNEVDTKADNATIPNGTYNVSGIWSEGFYGSRSFWVNLPRADLYTITLTRARYASTSTQMTDITSTSSVGTANALGFAITTTSNADNHFGDVQFTIAKA